MCLCRRTVALVGWPKGASQSQRQRVHVRLNFIHERGKGPNPTPIVLTHGWPGLFHRFHKSILMLTDPQTFGGKPEDSFDVIVPSIPGFGFSERSVNVQHFAKIPRGGHFAALTEPKLFVHELREFFGRYR